LFPAGRQDHCSFAVSWCPEMAFPIRKVRCEELPASLVRVERFGRQLSGCGVDGETSNRIRLCVGLTQELASGIDGHGESRNRSCSRRWCYRRNLQRRLPDGSTVTDWGWLPAVKGEPVIAVRAPAEELIV
jgi:hypothetical protein